MTDRYDRMDHRQLLVHIAIRGKPNWADFPASTIRELCRDDDRDIEEAERTGENW